MFSSDENTLLRPVIKKKLQFEIAQDQVIKISFGEK